MLLSPQTVGGNKLSDYWRVVVFDEGIDEDQGI